MCQRGGVKVYHLVPLLSDYVRANCEGKMSTSAGIGLGSQLDFRMMSR